jgi:hypothetical protein
MEKIKLLIDFVVMNKENMVMVLVGLGVILEGLNKIFPTKDGNSFLEKAGKFVTKLLSKIPSNIKKVEEKK